MSIDFLRLPRLGNMQFIQCIWGEEYVGAVSQLMDSVSRSSNLSTLPNSLLGKKKDPFFKGSTFSKSGHIISVEYLVCGMTQRDGADFLA